MTRPRLLAALAAALVLALPSAAMAGGAGDQQYQDPFGNSTPQSQAPKSGSTPTQTQQTPTQAPASQPQTAVSPTSSTTAPAGTTAASGQLPRTGLDTRVLGGIALLLVGGGLVLRRRLS